MKDNRPRLFLILFALLVSMPINPFFFDWHGTVSLNENRNLAVAPQFPSSLNELNEWPEKIEAYIKDRIAFRDGLLQLNYLLTFSIFGQLESKSVLAGESGWYFFRDDRNLDSYRNVESMNDLQLKTWVNFFLELQALATNSGAKMYVLFPPSSSTIYGQDYMPNWVKKRNEHSRMDQLMPAMRQAGLNVLGFRKLLIKKKSEFPLYQKTDTHWNSYGAFFAYERVFVDVQKDFPALKPALLTDFEFKNEVRPAGDMGVMLGLRKTLTETQNPWMNPKNKKNFEMTEEEARTYTKAGPADIRLLRVKCQTCGSLKAFVFHDSFFTYLEPYFYPHFAETTLLNKFFSKELFKKAKPDILFVEITERRLMQNKPPPIE